MSHVNRMKIQVKELRMDRVFLELSGLLRGLSQGQSPWEIPLSSPASPRKILSIPPLLLGLTQSNLSTRGMDEREI